VITQAPVSSVLLEFEHSDTMLRELQDDTRENYQAALTDQVEPRLLDGSPGPLLQIVRCRTGKPEICDRLWGQDIALLRFVTPRVLRG
jgi:hypothetical protein